LHDETCDVSLCRNIYRHGRVKYRLNRYIFEPEIIVSPTSAWRLGELCTRPISWGRTLIPDTPLKRWRQPGLTQAALAARCGVQVNTIARWERGEHVPRGDELETLLQVTGLPTDALVRPPRFLDAHPAFLGDYASPTL
jgi:hypothetical protein